MMQKPRKAGGAAAQMQICAGTSMLVHSKAEALVGSDKPGAADLSALISYQFFQVQLKPIWQACG